MTPSGNIHGMPVACACGFGPDELTTIGGVKGAISPKDVYQIGIRSVDAKENTSSTKKASLSLTCVILMKMACVIPWNKR